MDLRAQAVSIWLRRWPILAGAIAVGLLVLAVSYLLPREYLASTTVRVVESGGGETSVQSETVTFYGQSVAGLASTPDVLDAVVARSGLPVTRDQVAAGVTVTESSIPGFLTVAARTASAADAARLVDAMTGALAAKVTQDNATATARSTGPLRAEAARLQVVLGTLPPLAPDRGTTEAQANSLVDTITRLQAGAAPQVLVGSPAVPPSIPESPTPRRNALLAFVIALIVLAEGVVVVRAVRGRLSERDPDDEVTRLLGVPAVHVRSRDTAPAVLVPLLRRLPAGEDRITVVQLGGPKDLDVGRRVQTSAALVAVGTTSEERAAVPRVMTLRGRRVDQSILEGVRRAEGPVVLAVDTARTGRRSLEEGLAALAAVGGQVLGVVVWAGHFPRDRAGASAGPSSTVPADRNGHGTAADAVASHHLSPNGNGVSEGAGTGRR